MAETPHAEAKVRDLVQPRAQMPQLQSPAHELRYLVFKNLIPPSTPTDGSRARAATGVSGSGATFPSAGL